MFVSAAQPAKSPAMQILTIDTCNYVANLSSFLGISVSTYPKAANSACGTCRTKCKAEFQDSCHEIEKQHRKVCTRNDLLCYF